MTQVHEGTGANRRRRLDPPYFFESGGQDATTGAGTLTTGFAGATALDQPSVRCARGSSCAPQFTQQWNVFAEYLLMPSRANIGYVGHNADHLVMVEGTGRCPAW